MISQVHGTSIIDTGKLKSTRCSIFWR